MNRDISVQARWDDEAEVWTATSRDVPGLVIEADSLPAVVREIELVLPEFLELSGFA
ncbi:MAG TPA: DUF1902 domain-containing protein [Pseudolabrys sp.]|nr:DUF1902 domain-containing protein [Pseudolabrys sp.]